MAYTVLKLCLSAVIVFAVSEIAKRSTGWGAFLASLPILSLLAIGWLYFETRDVERIAGLSMSIFWLVLPSLLFFVLFPKLLRHGVAFGWSLLLAIAATSAGYAVIHFIQPKAPP
jgi:hypothetical protein